MQRKRRRRRNASARRRRRRRRRPILPAMNVAIDRGADRKGAEAGGGARPAGGKRLPLGDHGKHRVAIVAPPVHPRAELRRELDRWCACRRFVYQFSLMAKPTGKKGNTGRGGRGGWKPRRGRPTPIRSRKTGLAAVKHRQAVAERAAQAQQQGRAFRALAQVVAPRGRTAMTSKPTPHPHRPPSVGPSLGQFCEHCRSVVASRDVKGHFAGGCPALKAG